MRCARNSPGEYCHQHQQGQKKDNKAVLGAKVLEFDLVLSRNEEDGGMGDTQSVGSLSKQIRAVVEQRIHDDSTGIKGIVEYQLEQWGNAVLSYTYEPPDTVRLELREPITKAQRDYLGGGVVDPDNVGPDTWMEGDITILQPFEDASYPFGAELLVMLKDERGVAYDCSKFDRFMADPGPAKRRDTKKDGGQMSEAQARALRRLR